MVEMYTGRAGLSVHCPSQLVSWIERVTCSPPTSSHCYLQSEEATHQQSDGFQSLPSHS